MVNALDGYPAAFWREFDGVTEQVVQDLLKADAIRLNQRLALQFLLNLNVFRHCQRMDGGKYLG